MVWIVGMADSDQQPRPKGASPEKDSDDGDGKRRLLYYITVQGAWIVVMLVAVTCIYFMQFDLYVCLAPLAPLGYTSGALYPGSFLPASACRCIHCTYQHTYIQQHFVFTHIFNVSVYNTGGTSSDAQNNESNEEEEEDDDDDERKVFVLKVYMYIALCICYVQKQCIPVKNGTALIIFCSAMICQNVDYWSVVYLLVL